MAIEIPDLEKQLADAKTPQEEIEALNLLAWEQRLALPERSLALSRRALEVCAAAPLDPPLGPSGRAAALTTLGFLALQAQEFDRALAQCLEALALLEDQPASRVRADALRVVAWAYYFLDEFSASTSSGAQALKTAQEAGLRLEEAAARDVLALACAASGDIAQAREHHRAALQGVKALREPLHEAALLNNQAEVLAAAGDLEPAWEAARASLEIARCLDLPALRVSVLETAALIALKTARLEEAGEFLAQALGLAEQHSLLSAQARCQLRQSALRRVETRLDLAARSAARALELAQLSGSLALQAEAHAALAEVLEAEGRPAEALAELKLSGPLGEEALRQAAERRAAALRAAHASVTARFEAASARFEAETARFEAETARFEAETSRFEADTARFEAEIGRLSQASSPPEPREQARAETGLDPLTQVLERRAFFERAQREFDRSLRYHRPLSLLMIAVDGLRRGRDGGDQLPALLAALLRQNLREVDLLGRYGAEEFAAALPETALEQARLVAERLREQVESRPFELPSGPVPLAVSIGASCLQENGLILGDELDHLIDRAAQACQAARRSQAS